MIVRMSKDFNEVYQQALGFNLRQMLVFKKEVNDQYYKRFSLFHKSYNRLANSCGKRFHFFQKQAIKSFNPTPLKKKLYNDKKIERIINTCLKQAEKFSLNSNKFMGSLKESVKNIVNGDNCSNIIEDGPYEICKEKLEGIESFCHNLIAKSLNTKKNNNELLISRKVDACITAKLHKRKVRSDNYHNAHFQGCQRDYAQSIDCPEGIYIYSGSNSPKKILNQLTSKPTRKTRNHHFGADLKTGHTVDK